MQIYVHTDHHIDGREGMTAHVEREVETALARLSHGITRIEVHLSDQSAGRSTGAGIRCLIEARPAGRSPVTVSDDAGTVNQALSSAVHKLSRLLDSNDGQRDDHDGRSSIRGHAER